MPGIQKDSQIIGLRLSLSLARDVKEEAARRGMRINKLFEEMWTLYRNSRKGKQNNGG